MLEKMLKNIDIFSNLDQDELKNIAKISSIRTLNARNVLFFEGDEADSFFVLLQGDLKLYKTGIKSQEIVLHYFTKPTMIAEMATLENIPFPATCVATVDETIVAVIDKDKFIKMLQNGSSFSFHIIKSLTKKIKNLELAINRNLIFDATTKVCSLLKENPEILMSQKNIQVANLLNMAPETLSRTLSKLKKLKILNKDNTVSDMEKLDMFLEF